MSRRKKLLLAALCLLLCVAVPVVAQRIKKHGGLIDITSAGAVTVTPATGQSIALAGNTAVTGTLSATGAASAASLNLGGATVLDVLTATASLNFGATAAGACDALTITVTGAADGDSVSLGIPAALMSASEYQTIQGYVSAANTVTVKRCNLTNATTALSDPAAATVRATVLKF